MIIEVLARWSSPMKAWQCPACYRTFWNDQWRSNPCGCGLEYVVILGQFWHTATVTIIERRRSTKRTATSRVFDATPF